ncbi:MAG: hypothetical protein PVH63_13425 [Balneolaceae bacterium]|jgi:hypothetical protein
MEKSSRYLLLALLFILVAGILYFNSENSAKKKGYKHPPQADTTALQQRLSITAGPDTVPPPENTVAPGTVMIEAQIRAVDYSDGSPERITISVNEVLGYGSSTPPIAPDSKLILNVSGFLRANPEYRDVFKKGADLRAVLAYREGLKKDTSHGVGSWAIKNIEH